MNHLAHIVNGILIYMAIFTPLCAILQAITGVDLSSYITGSGIFGIVELALTAIIQMRKKQNERKDKQDEQDQLEAETFEP